MPTKLVTLNSHLLSEFGHSASARDLAQILERVVLASKVLSRDINKAGLVDILGSTGKTNVQQEDVQKLDEYANHLFCDLLSELPTVRAVASEEMEDFFSVKENASTGKYVVFLDPLDGSANTDVNINVGSIFSICKLEHAVTGKNKTEENELFLSATKNIVAAGYVVYGPSTMLVYSAGKGVHGFTLDPSIGEYVLSHPHLRFPEPATFYSINESYAPGWDKAMTEFVREAKGKENPSGKPLNAMYVGALVADFHRCLLKGGMYAYPATAKHKEGKLRFIFEFLPLAFVAEQCGGSHYPQLVLPPPHLHQRTPVFLGSKSLVDYLKSLYYRI